MNRICFSLRSCYGFGVWLLAGERADLGERPPRPARQGDRQRVGGQAEGGDERDADNRDDPAVPVAVTARAAAAAVLRATSTTGLPAGRSGRWPGPGRLATPMSQAGRSSPARVVTPAPPCAPTRTTSPGGACRGAGAGPACRGRGSAV